MFGTPLNTIVNARKPIYIAHLKEITHDEYNNEIAIYEKPQKYKASNYQHLVGNALESYQKTYGITSQSIVRCLIDYRDTNKFKERDIVYLYGADPYGELVYGDNANYVVKAIKPQNTKTMILFEEIVKEK